MIQVKSCLLQFYLSKSNKVSDIKKICKLKLQAVLRALAVACNLPPMQVGLLRFVNEAIPRQEKVLMTDLSVPIKGAKLCS